MNDENIPDIMSEPPGGDNFGTEIQSVRVKDDDVSTTRTLPLDAGKTAFLQDGGWITVSVEGGRQRELAGLTSHRGVLHPDEYVDKAVLREAAEEALGFTYEEVSSAYTNGRPTTEQRQLRERIDSRLLALSRAGGRMVSLASALGLNEKTIDRALARARLVEVSPIVVNPAVRTRTVCFKCETEGARPRKRRHSTSPEQWVGTVDLCDKCYGEGFETRPGNPRYWEHRLATRPIEPQGLKPTPRREQVFPADYPSDAAYREFVARSH